MSQTFVLRDRDIARRAVHAIGQALQADLHEVVIRPHKSKRTLDQNALMWALLTELSEQVVWHGQRLTKEEWKDVCTAALKRQKVVPGIDGGFVVLGSSTSKMSIQEMTELVELIYAFGAEHGVRFTDARIAA